MPCPEALYQGRKDFLMKWKHNGITYPRGSYEALIARYNSDGAWFVARGLMTQQTMRSSFKALGEALNAHSIEVKRLYDDNDNETETEVIVFMKRYDGRYTFYLETPERLQTIDSHGLDTITHFFHG